MQEVSKENYGREWRTDDVIETDIGKSEIVIALLDEYRRVVV